MNRTALREPRRLLAGVVSLCLFAPRALLAGGGAPASSPRVAIILNLGDYPEYGNGEFFNALERKADAVYSALGFQVIHLGGSSSAGAPAPSPAALLATIQGLRSVSDLRIDVIGHGDYFTPAPADAVRFEPMRFAFGRGAHRLALGRDIAGLSWKAENLWPKAVAPGPGSPTPSSEDFGVGDFRSAARSFRRRNPDGVLALNFLNCYSGAVAEQLRSEAGLLVLGVPAVSPNILYPQSRDSRYPDAATSLGAYYDFILGGHGNPSFNAVSSLSFGEMLAQAALTSQREAPSGINVGIPAFSFIRSPLLNAVLGFCDGTAPQEDPVVEGTDGCPGEPGRGDPTGALGALAVNLPLIEPWRIILKEHDFSRRFLERQARALNLPELRKKAEAWRSYRQARAQLTAEKACLDYFQEKAPAGEWANLIRLFKLGSRPASGRSG